MGHFEGKKNAAQVYAGQIIRARVAKGRIHGGCKGIDTTDFELNIQSSRVTLTILPAEMLEVDTQGVFTGDVRGSGGLTSMENSIVLIEQAAPPRRE